MAIIEQHATEFDTDFIVYSSNFCPYCVAAKRVLKQKGLSFEEINFDQEPELRMAVVEQTNHRTVPVIIDNRNDAPVFVGGFDEMQSYFKAGN
jgi:glutaredoxin 3